MPHQCRQKLAPRGGEFFEGDCFECLAAAGKDAGAGLLVGARMIDQAAGHVHRAVGPQHEPAARPLGAAEVGGQTRRGPDDRGVGRHHAGRRHEKITGRGFVDISREKAGQLDLNRLVAWVGEVDLGAPQVARAAFDVESEGRKHQLTGGTRERRERKDHPEKMLAETHQAGPSGRDFLPNLYCIRKRRWCRLSPVNIPRPEAARG